MTEQEWMTELEKEGFKEIRVCPIPPNQDLPEHTHNERTVHIILEGGLTIEDAGGTSTYHPGERVEFHAGTTHRARGVTESGKMIIGMKP